MASTDGVVEPATVMGAAKRSNVRSAPETRYPKVGLLKDGEQVSIIEWNGNWFIQIAAPFGPAPPVRLWTIAVGDRALNGGAVNSPVTTSEGGPITRAPPPRHGHPQTMTFGAGRRCRKICDSSLMRTHAQSRAEIESPRARVPYMPGCEFSPPAVLPGSAHTAY